MGLYYYNTLFDLRDITADTCDNFKCSLRDSHSCIVRLDKIL